LKLIYVVIDGVGDFPTAEQKNETPLSAAHTPNLDELAHKGRTGLMYAIRKGIAPQSDASVISILGYDPFHYAPGLIFKVGAVQAITRHQINRRILRMIKRIERIWRKSSPKERIALVINKFCTNASAPKRGCNFLII
jgi:hypothetical protein